MKLLLQIIKAKFIWTDSHKTNFNKIITAGSLIVETFHYNPSLETKVKCDASREGLGAALEQQTPYCWETIAYASRILNDAEKHYSINELELLEVVWSIEHFRHYLYGKRFTVVTDQRALLSIIKEKTSKIHQSRLTLWTDRLLPFDFKLEHIAGSKMGFVDYISGNPDAKTKSVSKYNEEFVVAQIDAICKTSEILKQKRGRGRPKKNILAQANVDRKESMQSNQDCNKNANNADYLQRTNFNQTPNVYNTRIKQLPHDHNGKSHDSHNYNLRKRRTTECKECKRCIYQCVKSETHANNSLLPNSPKKDQSRANLNKLYSNPNSIYSSQNNSNSISHNSCKKCTVPNSSIPPIQINSSANPLPFITPKLLCLNPL